MTSITSCARSDLSAWLQGLSRHTARAYRSAIERLEDHASNSAEHLSSAELSAYATHLQTLDLTPGSRRARLAAIKSYFAWLAQAGGRSDDPAASLRLPRAKDALNERILNVEQVRRLIAAAGNVRDGLILRTLYGCGVRVSELCALRWRDVSERGSRGVLTVFGKGDKTRTVNVPPSLWPDLLRWRAAVIAQPDMPIFPSRHGGDALDTSTVLRTLKAAAAAAGLSLHVSPHWLRHCHCSHALDAGAKLHLVQATVGHASISTTSKYLHANPEQSSGDVLAA